MDIYILRPGRKTECIALHKTLLTNLIQIQETTKMETQNHELQHLVMENQIHYNIERYSNHNQLSKYGTPFLAPKNHAFTIS